jgi:hypothetical protein
VDAKFPSTRVFWVFSKSSCPCSSFTIHGRRPHPLLPHRLGLGRGEDADEGLHPRLRPHLSELCREARRNVVEAHDQLGDVRVHQVGVLVHILQRGVLHVQLHALIQFRPRRLDPAGDGGNLRLRLGHLSLALLDLRLEIGHPTLR